MTPIDVIVANTKSNPGTTADCSENRNIKSVTTAYRMVGCNDKNAS